MLELPSRAGEFYASIRAALTARGELVGNNDLWIAAHAKAADLILVTNNEREFCRIDGNSELGGLIRIFGHNPALRLSLTR